MFSVLIIDDEPNVRKGLKLIVPWEENGFRICDEAGDPDEGLKKILSLRPDIVLIDIRMSGKLGTEVIREAIQGGFKGKFVIVSGYSNFEYAKDAIKYGVKSYILKPIDEDELMGVLLELAEEIRSEQKLEGNKEIIKRVKLQKLILEEDTDIDDVYNSYNSFQTALVYSLEHNKNDSKILELEKYIKNKLGNYTDDIDVTTINRYAVILLKGFRYARAFKTIAELREKIKSDIYDNVFIAIGNKVDNIKLISQSYKTAEEIMKNRFLYLEKGIMSDKILDEEKTKSIDTIDYEKIYNYVEVNDIEQLETAIRTMSEYMKQKKYSEEEVKIIIIKIYLELREKVINDYDLEQNSLKSKEGIMKEIHSKTSLSSIADYLISNFTQISLIIGSKSSDNIGKRLISYINKNYYKDLKLETLAELFNYNSAYLGKLFKSEVGENFNTYLDKVRIEKAKYLLLEEQLKVYKVCEKVGYKNLDYFYNKFKKYVGTSPLNYKKQNNKEE